MTSPICSQLATSGTSPDRVVAGLTLTTDAQRRLADDLLAWGRGRPEVGPGVASVLADRIERALVDEAARIREYAAAQPRGRILVTKTRLDRLACDGWAIDPEPFRYSWASMRGILAHAVVERDWRDRRRAPVAIVVDEVWRERASRRAGDPSSDSAWMNALDPDDAQAMRDELITLASGFREVWPELPADLVESRLESAYSHRLFDGRVELFGRPDIVLDGRRHDGRARSLVIDLKTGRPRPEHDRHELRFYALLVALATGRPPFRWATFYVTEGRYEIEDLDEQLLEAAARRVVDGVRQQLRIDAAAVTGDESRLTIRGGAWCDWCMRRDDCDEAARARAAHEEMSQGDGIIDP